MPETVTVSEAGPEHAHPLSEEGLERLRKQAFAQSVSARVYWGAANGGIVDAVWEERLRQLAKRGLQHRPSGTSHDVWYPQEMAAKEEYEATKEGSELTWVHILKEEVYEAFAEEDVEKLKVELIQVMAVAASWLQDLELSA